MIRVLVLFSILCLNAYGFDCLDLNLKPVIESTYSTSPAEDFRFRDQLPQTELDPSAWKSCCGKYGPCPLTYPKVETDPENQNPEWQRKRVIAAAKKYIGLAYLPRHIPAMQGLDCSNYTAWVYNYAFGIRFSSNIQRQAETAGRKLTAHEPMMPGDLIYLWSEDRRRISHVAIYLDQKSIIDSTGIGVQIRPYQGWYRSHFAWARRIID